MWDNSHENQRPTCAIAEARGVHLASPTIASAVRPAECLVVFDLKTEADRLAVAGSGDRRTNQHAEWQPMLDLKHFDLSVLEPIEGGEQLAVLKFEGEVMRLPLRPGTIFSAELELLHDSHLRIQNWFPIDNPEILQAAKIEFLHQFDQPAPGLRQRTLPGGWTHTR